MKKGIKFIVIFLGIISGGLLAITYWFATTLLVISLLVLMSQRYLTRKYTGKKRLSIPLYLVLLGSILGSFTYGIIHYHVPKKVNFISFLTNTTQLLHTLKQPKLNEKQRSDRLKTALTAIGDQQDVAVSIAVFHNGTVTSYNKALTDHFYTASIVKVAIATLLLHNRAQQGVALSEDEDELLTDMIENSSNEAATNLLEDYLGGYDSLTALYQALNMTNTTVNMDAWGLTETTAADQLKLLHTVFDKNEYLTPASQQYLQNLMSNVADDQIWGIGAGAKQVFLKNGWLEDDNGWILNSMGKVISDNDSADNYLMVVLTNGSATQETGEKLIEQLTKETSTILFAD